MSRQQQQQQPQQLAPGVQLLGVTQDETGRPVYIVRDQGNKKRSKGLDAHKANIAVARALANTLRTSLGPRGMDKILVSPDREVTITNDGATIMQKMDVANHVARLLVDLSRCQDSEVGDGTTGVVVLAGSLLEQAETLLDKGIHPVRIAEGYDKACEIACAHLKTIAEDLDLSKGNDLLLRAAKTSLGSKIVNRYHDQMAKIAVEAVLGVADLKRHDVDFERIKVRAKAGGSLEETRLYDGIIIDQDMSHIGMKTRLQNAKVAVLSCPFEPPKPKTKYSIEVDTAEKYRRLHEEEQRFFTDMVQKVKNSGAELVICQWGFDDEANHLLYKAGICAVRWAKAEDLEAVAMCTGARIVSRFEDLSPEKLGVAKQVEVQTLGTANDKVLLISGESSAKGDQANVPEKVLTVFIRGGNSMLLEEARRSLHDAMCVVRSLVREARVVCGGGAAEIACGLAVASAAEKCGTADFYALRAFSEALDAIPLALARNAGLQPVEALAKARSLQLTKGPSIGIDCGEVETIGVKNEQEVAIGAADMKEKHVFETLGSKTQQLLLATQVVRMILKIDEVIEEGVIE